MNLFKNKSRRLMLEKFHILSESKQMLIENVDKSLNNPMGLSDMVAWLGKTGGGGNNWNEYSDVLYGLRSGLRNLKYGKALPKKINELGNNLEAFVSAYTGVDPQELGENSEIASKLYNNLINEIGDETVEPLSWGKSGNENMGKLVKAIINAYGGNVSDNVVDAFIANVDDALKANDETTFQEVANKIKDMSNVTQDDVDMSDETTADTENSNDEAPVEIVDSPKTIDSFKNDTWNQLINAEGYEFNDIIDNISNPNYFKQFGLDSGKQVIKALYNDEKALNGVRSNNNKFDVINNPNLLALHASLLAEALMMGSQKAKDPKAKKMTYEILKPFIKFRDTIDSETVVKNFKGELQAYLDEHGINFDNDKIRRFSILGIGDGKEDNKSKGFKSGSGSKRYLINNPELATTVLLIGNLLGDKKLERKGRKFAKKGDK